MVAEETAILTAETTADWDGYLGIDGRGVSGCVNYGGAGIASVVSKCCDALA